MRTEHEPSGKAAPRQAGVRPLRPPHAPGYREAMLLTRPSGSPPQTLAEYQAEGGFSGLRAALAAPPDALIAQLDTALLRGRGGAAFPTARKWRLSAGQAAAQKYVVANGGEHEPGSRKDRHLVEYYPHKVLEGLLLCGYATGASVGWLYLIEDMAGPLHSAERAIAELTAAGLLGNNLLGSGFNFEVRVHKAPTTYVAGEETAALESIEGRPAKPRSKPPYPGEAGLFGQPTTVNNVETLAQAALVARHGGAWFRAIGKGESTGTLLFTLGEQVVRPGVYELPFGATYRELIFGLGGGTRSGRGVRGILPAMSSGWLPASALDLPFEHAAFKALGSGLGCGGVSLLEEGQSVLEPLATIAQFFMAEQCGQCPPCRMETNHLVAILKAVREGRPGDHAGQVHKITEFTRGKGRCSLIEMAAAPVVSALRLFPEDFRTP